MFRQKFLAFNSTLKNHFYNPPGFAHLTTFPSLHDERMKMIKPNNRILIVDDNPDIHADFRKILCPQMSTQEIDKTEEALFGKAMDTAPQAFYQLSSAYQGQEAVSMVRKAMSMNEPFALAFVDVRMPPGIDGVETIKQLWAIDPDLEVVISTAYSDYSWEQLRETLHQADWLLILKKPFDNIEVLQLTKALTRKWKLERDTQVQLASLRRANALLEAQRETSIDGILVVDESRKVLAYNGQFVKLWGVPEAVTATNDDNLLLASVASNLRDPLSFYDRLSYLYEHPTESSRDEVCLHDGRVFDRYSTPILGDEGQNFGRIWYFRDITKEREAESLLRKAKDIADMANNAKSTFLANMSHEIRTPMTAILGYADLLAEEASHGKLTGEQRSDYVLTIKRNGEHLLSIINDILDLSKIESGKMSVEQIDVRPAQILDSVLSLMHVNARAKGLELSVVYDSPVPESILSDPLRLRQVLVNLIGNAIKFTEVGAVTVHVSFDAQNSSDSALRFRIEDTGVGMTVEQVSRLFSAFEQADASTTRKFGGTGLGLRISKRLAEVLGGDIAVTSQPGKGSAFTFSLKTGPAKKLGLTDMTKISRTIDYKPAAPTPIGKLLDGVRILLVEDGLDNQRLIAHLLRNAGATVDMRENGELAVQALTVDGTLGSALVSVSPFDLVLMDMHMPKMDGYTATRLLRQKGYARPIIALTAKAMSGDADECKRAGCDEYAVKPIDARALITICASQARALKLAESAQQLHADHESLPDETDQVPLKSTLADDPIVGPILQEFLAGLPMTVASIEKSVASRNWSELMHASHQLAGAAGMYGYSIMTDAARDLEILAHSLSDGAKSDEVLSVAGRLTSLCRRACLADGVTRAA